MKIVAFAYACEPQKGSEPAAGWMWARMLAGLGETWVITRANNADVIEAALPALPERDQLRFVYVDLPSWSRFWKKGQRGVRLYYLLWQVAALRKARRLHKRESFDVVWHLTLANAWLGSLAPLLGPSFVYGPVGGGPSAPWRLLPAFGIRGVLFEVFRTVARSVGRYANPAARIAWKRAELILVQNRETLAFLPRRHRSRPDIFPHAVLDERPEPLRRNRDGQPTAFFAGRLIPWKGLSLAVATLQLLPEWRLVICGEGPDELRIKRLARRKGVEDRVEFRGWVAREEVQRLMREEADLLLLPSMHDDSPFVVPEALAAGVPVVCLDRGGAPSLGGVGVPVTDRAGTVKALAETVRRALGGPVPPVPSLGDHRERLSGILQRAGLASTPLGREQ
jgi:glycosyltransferase involved in cell wall biosynthesis